MDLGTLVRGTGNGVRGTRYRVRGTRYEVPGTRYQVRGIRYEVQGTRPGTRYKVRGMMYRVRCTGNEVPVKSTGYEVTGTKVKSPETWPLSFPSAGQRKCQADRKMSPFLLKH